MAVTTTPLSTSVGANIVTDLASNATSESDVRAGATTVFIVDVDNTANVAVTYVKLYDSAGPTIGTTAPDVVLRVTGSARKSFVLDMSGVAFTTGLSFASVTAGGTAGTSNPSSSVIVRILTS